MSDIIRHYAVRKWFYGLLLNNTMFMSIIQNSSLVDWLIFYWSEEDKFKIFLSKSASSDPLLFAILLNKNFILRSALFYRMWRRKSTQISIEVLFLSIFGKIVWTKILSKKWWEIPQPKQKTQSISFISP